MGSSIMPKLNESTVLLIFMSYYVIILNNLSFGLHGSLVVFYRKTH